MKKWCDDYKDLDLSGGKISFILQDDEDMIEIRYSDGMLIDVGYIESEKRIISRLLPPTMKEDGNNLQKKLKLKIERICSKKSKKPFINTEDIKTSKAVMI